MRTCLFLTFLAGILHAQGGAQERRICTERTIQGSYGYTFIGARLASPMPGAPIVEGRGVGIRIFDGQGNFTQVDSVKGGQYPGPDRSTRFRNLQDQSRLHWNGFPHCAWHARRCPISFRRGQQRERDLFHSREPDWTDDSNACRPAVKFQQPGRTDRGRAPGLRAPPGHDRFAARRSQRTQPS